MKTLQLSFATLSIAFAGIVAAQSTVGELKEKGGKVLTAAETKQELSGAKMSTPAPNGGWYELQYNQDESLGGSLESTQGGRYNVSGKWSVNEKDQFCWDFSVPRLNRQVTGCSGLFRLGSDLFVDSGGQGDAATIAKREIKK